MALMADGTTMIGTPRARFFLVREWPLEAPPLRLLRWRLLFEREDDELWAARRAATWQQGAAKPPNRGSHRRAGAAGPWRHDVTIQAGCGCERVEGAAAAQGAAQGAMGRWLLLRTSFAGPERLARAPPR